MKNTFLQSLSKQIIADSEQIKISGNSFYVVKIDQSSNGALMLEAERLAKKYLSDSQKDLEAQKLAAKERNEVKEQLYLSSSSEQEKAEIDKMLNELKSRYDLELMLERLRLLGSLMVAECLRDKDGAKIYANREERQQVIDMLAASPETMQAIQEAQGRLQKKSLKSE